MRFCNPAGLQIVLQCEGLKLSAYPDENEPPTWTIGYGHTQGVTPDMTCTLEQAVVWLHTDMGAVEHILSDWLCCIPINSNQFSACCSLAFNIGVENFRNCDVAKALREQDFAQAAKEFPLNWNKVTKNGVKVISSGLTARREMEQALFNQ